MKNPFEIGDEKSYSFTVSEDHFARFPDEGLVHPVLSTFALTQFAEWASRLFVLEMIEEGEQGIGSSVQVNHRAPAVAGTEVTIVATLQGVKNEIVQCSWEASDGARKLAEGTTEQRIIKLEEFEDKLEDLREKQSESN
ncbi:MAG: thioesterase family protein [Bacteroidota bacterium]